MHAGNADDELKLEAEQRVGCVLRDKWCLDRLIGVGGMGAVYAATHRNGSRGAVKVLHAALTLSREIRTRFLREGYAANQVNHPGVVQVIDDDEDQGVVFLVMELLEGETLEERWLRNGSRLPADEVLSVADQVLDVLAAAHDKGIVHRDLKPENLFLTKEGRIKVLDFGIARLRHASTSPRSHTGGTFGTPAFMPPEQALGHIELVDARSDLWALGATLFTLISGRFVHEGTTVNEQLLSAMTKAAPPLETVAPCVCPEVAQLVDRALAREKSSRFEDALSMQQAVREAYDALPEGFDLPTVIVRDVARPARPPAAKSSFAKHRGIVASAIAGFVVIAAFYAFHGSSPTPSPDAAAVLQALPQTAPVRVVRGATARTFSLMPSPHASRELTPKAFSVDELPPDIDEESAPRARSVAAAPPLAPAMAQPVTRMTEAAPAPSAPPVEPKEVHLEESPPSPYDDPNPYDDPPSATSVGARSTSVQRSRP